MRNLAASFLVYLFPLVGPHFVSFWGIVLWMELVTQRGKREPAWIAMDLALAFLLQAAAFLVFLLASRIRSVLRYLLPIAAAPFLMALLNYAYMVGIPERFLIEDVDAPEKTDWPVACTVAGGWIAPVRAGASLALEEAGRAVLVRSDEEWISLAMPGCEVRPLGLKAVNAGGTYVSPDGAVLFYRWDVQAQKQTTWLLSAGASEPVELVPPPEAKNWYPTLSSDGTAFAWLTSSRTTGGAGFEHSVRVHRIAENETHSVPVPRESMQPQLIGLDSDELVIACNRNEVIALDLEGNPLWGPIAPAGIESVIDNFRRLGDGFVAWDVYRESGRYRVSFRLPHGEGIHEIPKGRSISAVSVDPSGKLVAISVSPSLSIGNVRDAVYVIRAADRTEVYRRNLPAYSRSQVAFLRSEFLALTLVENGESRVEVLRVPESLLDASAPR